MTVLCSRSLSHMPLMISSQATRLRHGPVPRDLESQVYVYALNSEPANDSDGLNRGLLTRLHGFYFCHLRMDYAILLGVLEIC